MKPQRNDPRGFKSHDGHAPDGITSEGFRVVRSGGRVKFASVWWQSDALKPYEGETVFCQGQDYWQTMMHVSTCHGGFNWLCNVTPLDTALGSNLVRQPIPTFRHARKARGFAAFGATAS
jgi:hypothetical protein